MNCIGTGGIKHFEELIHKGAKASLSEFFIDLSRINDVYEKKFFSSIYKKEIMVHGYFINPCVKNLLCNREERPNKSTQEVRVSMKGGSFSDGGINWHP